MNEHQQLATIRAYIIAHPEMLAEYDALPILDKWRYCNAKIAELGLDDLLAHDLQGMLNSINDPKYYVKERLDFDLYAHVASHTNTYHKPEHESPEDALPILFVALAEEVGEACGKYKKCKRDNGGVITEEIKEAIKGELGDVLYYLSQIALACGLSFQDVAESNNEKTTSRAKRGKISGSGDNR